MNKVILSFIILLTCLKLSSQTTSWVTSGAGDLSLISNGYTDMGYSVISDGESLYVTGLVIGTKAKVQDSIVNFISSAHEHCFIAKYSNQGELIWIKELPGRYDTDIALDSNNEILVTSSSLHHSYISKYDIEGNLLWMKEIVKDAIFSSANAISIDNEDAIIVCGWIYTSGYGENTLTVEDTLIQGLQGGNHGYIIKYNSAGEFKWINTTNRKSETNNSKTTCIFKDVKVDHNNDLVLIGDFATAINDSLIIGSSQITSTGQNLYSPTKDIVVVKYNSNGNLLWAKTFGGIEDDWGNKVSINSQNEIQLVGTFTDSVMFNDSWIMGNGSYDIYLSKLTPDGEAKWIKTAGGFFGSFSQGVEAGRSVYNDPEDNIFITGSFLRNAIFGENENVVTVSSENDAITQSGFIAKYSFDGNLVWVKNIIGNRSTIKDVFIDDSRIYITGNFFPEVSLMGFDFPVTYAETYNFFIASINTNTTSITEFALGKNIETYPNPTSGKVFINSNNFDKISIIYVYNSRGELIQSIKNNLMHAELDLSHEPNGIYILRILTDSGFAIKKIIKTN